MKHIDLPAYDCKQKPCSIVKKIGCMAGDTLIEKDGSYYCNDVFVCKSLPGRGNFIFSGQIPDSSMFIIGDNDMSYDSRYFGFAKVEDIDGILTPIY